MRHKIVPIKNVSRVLDASEALINRTLGMPGIGLIWGRSGLGKTTAATWMVNQCHGVYVRAIATSTPSSLLGAIMREVDIDVRGSTNADRVEAIVQKLAESQRPLFIDEADYIVESKRLTETLRDIHDLSTVPVILIGMDNIKRKLREREQFTGRIAQWVEFQPADMADARLLADGMCEVKIADDLLERLHKAATGSVRLITVGLGRLEQFARTRGMEALCNADWTGGEEFFIGKTSSSTPAKVTRLERR
jgi:DNA transposition AAA+ family ATPase